MAISGPIVTFGGTSLATVSGLRIVATNPYQPPERSLNRNQLARTDKGVIASAFYTARKITVTCVIGCNSRELLDASMDALNKILQGEEKALVLSQASGTRQYTATFANMMISDVRGGLARLDILFECSDAMGYDPASTTLAWSAFTGNTSTLNFVLDGTAEWQLPVITITFNSLTGGSNKAVTLSNPATGQTMVITRTWSNGDVLVINAKEGTVQVNGVDADFTGGFLKFALPSGSLTYSDNLTTRNVTVNIAYQKRYI